MFKPKASLKISGGGEEEEEQISSSIAVIEQRIQKISIQVQ